ncbi:hypothetical protein Syun_012397 [Stephania yunnanensis]|uniref:Uncharacterized protein n=1 Tax=Stephania yunnanensis TaxID=152371 RepID=A0AAP0K1R9_9MAGN
MSEDQRHLLDDHDEFMEQLMHPPRPSPRQEYVQRSCLIWVLHKETNLPHQLGCKFQRILCSCLCSNFDLISSYSFALIGGMIKDKATTIYLETLLSYSNFLNPKKFLAGLPRVSTSIYILQDDFIQPLILFNQWKNVGWWELSCVSKLGVVKAGLDELRLKLFERFNGFTFGE